MDKEYFYKEIKGQFFNGTIKEEQRQNQLLSPLGINFDTYRCLAYLAEHPNGVEPSAMSDDLLILRQTVTYTVDRLVKRGLVERLPHTTDKRRVLVRLLPKGKELTTQATQRSMDYHYRIMDYFSEKQLMDFIILRNQMAEVRDKILHEMSQEYPATEETKK